MTAAVPNLLNNAMQALVAGKPGVTYAGPPSAGWMPSAAAG